MILTLLDFVSLRFLHSTAFIFVPLNPNESLGKVQIPCSSQRWEVQRLSVSFTLLVTHHRVHLGRNILFEAFEIQVVYIDTFVEFLLVYAFFLLLTFLLSHL